MYNVGGIVGPFFAGPCAYDPVSPSQRAYMKLASPSSSSRDRFGRRVGMFMGGLIICIGTAVIATSPRVDQFIAGRFILGFGILQWRGKFTALYNCESTPPPDRRDIDALHQAVGSVAAFPHL